jgi:hypothetical protein
LKATRLVVRQADMTVAKTVYWLAAKWAVESVAVLAAASAATRVALLVGSRVAMLVEKTAA